LPGQCICIAGERGGFFGGKPICNTCHRSIDRGDWERLRALIDNGQTLTPKQHKLFLVLQKRFGPNPRKTEYNRARQRHQRKRESRVGRNNPAGPKRYTDDITSYDRELEDVMQMVGEEVIDFGSL